MSVHTDIATYTTNFVTSRDGARISYLSMGSGPALLVVHGALSVAKGYTAFASAKVKQFPKLDHFGIDKKAPQEVASVVEAFFLAEHP